MLRKGIFILENTRNGGTYIGKGHNSNTNSNSNPIEMTIPNDYYAKKWLFLIGNMLRSDYSY